LTLIATEATNVTLPASGTLMVNPMTTAGDVIYGGASGVPTRLAVGTNGYVLTLAAGVPTWAASVAAGKLIVEDSGYGLDNSSVGRGTVGSNAVSLEYSVSGSTYGATGSNSHAEGGTTTASGAGSHAEGSTTIASNNSSHAEGNTTISSGASSHAEGTQTTASGDRAHSEGVNNTASGNNSHAEGSENTASGLSSHSCGVYSIASHYSEYARASGRFSADGDCQCGNVQARIATAATAEVELFLDGISEQFTLADNDAYTCRVTVMGAQADGSIGDAVYQVKIHRQGTTTALSQSVQTILAWNNDTNIGAATWAITADDTNEALKITVTPANTTATRWTALLEYVKINY